MRPERSWITTTDGIRHAALMLDGQAGIYCGAQAHKAEDGTLANDLCKSCMLVALTAAQNTNH